MVSETELFKLIGKYEAQSENTAKHLESIDKKLANGDKCMQKLDRKIERNFSEQKLTVSQCQGEQSRNHESMEKKIDDLEESFDNHKKKPHVYHQTGADGRITRVKRHWLEILIASVGTIVSGLLIAWANSHGLIIG